MARLPKPWWRKDRGAWFVTIEGNRVNLGPDRASAFRRFHELMGQPRRRLVPTKSVVAIIDAFLDWAQRHRAKGTYEWYRERCQSFCRTITASQTADQLTPWHVQQWIDRNEGWSDGHKRGCIVAVQRPFTWAVQMGLLDKSPIARIEKPRAGKRNLVIEEAGFEAILKAVKDQSFRDLLQVAWETGARPQELLRVEARHVDAPHLRWVFPPEEAKVKSRPRVVYLSETAMAITQRLVQLWPKGPLFRNEDGNPWTRNAVSCRFGRLEKRIGKKYCLYVWRHSFATRLLKAGIDPLTVATLLGHADVSMLGRVYQHLSQSPKFLSEQLRRAAG